MSEQLLENLALVIVLGIIAQWLARRHRLLSMLLLLIFGSIAGLSEIVRQRAEVFG